MFWSFDTNSHRGEQFPDYLYHIFDEQFNEKQKKSRHENFQAFLRPYIQPLCGSSYTYEEGTQFVLDILQDPVMNKQLCYILLDVILDELFPEIIVKRSK